MPVNEEVEVLRRAISLCSRGAAAYKTAYMLALDQGMERVLLNRCTERYALLERLLSLGVERGLSPEEARDLLEDESQGSDALNLRLDAALTQARWSDRGLARLISSSLGEGTLSPALAACLGDQRRALEETWPVVQEEYAAGPALGSGLATPGLATAG
jgi:hypothetical protein